METLPAPITLERFALSPEAREAIDSALERAALVWTVANVQQQTEAVAAQVGCKRLVNEIEKVRKQLTEPALAFQREVMSAAKRAAEPLEVEYRRLMDLVSEFAAAERRREQEAMLRIQAEQRAKEEEVRRQAEQERERLRQEAITSAKNAQTAEDRARMDQALKMATEELRKREEEQLRLAAEQASLQAQAQAAQQSAGQIVREDWEIKVVDVRALGTAYPSSVRMEPIMAEVKRLLDSGLTLPGVIARRVVKSGVRTVGATIDV